MTPAQRFAALYELGSDEEFEAAFGMSRQCFDALPRWRQAALRRRLGLA
jgi:hypothetical protein